MNALPIYYSALCHFSGEIMEIFPADSEDLYDKEQTKMESSEEKEAVFLKRSSLTCGMGWNSSEGHG